MKEKVHRRDCVSLSRLSESRRPQDCQAPYVLNQPAAWSYLTNSRLGHYPGTDTGVIVSLKGLVPRGRIAYRAFACFSRIGFSLARPRLKPG